ncbi:MAG: hypothetical protein ABR540_09150 [Acidimicrobiales bacterium]
MAAVLAACSSGDRAELGKGGPAAPSQATTTAGAEPAPASTSLPAATRPSCPSVPERRPSDPARPRYVLNMDVQPPTGLVQGTVDVRFTPDLDTDRLVFRLWPNGPRQQGFGARMEAGPAEVDGRPAESSLEEPTVFVVRPAAALRAGQTVQVRLPWRLQLPFNARDRLSSERESIRMGSFVPLLEWEPGTGWVTEPPTTRFAEASTAPTADFDITVSSPPGFGVIATGTPDGPGHWTATAMRDVSVAVGRFTTVTGTANAPDPVQVTVGVDAAVGESPQPYLDRAIAVLEASSRRFGPYPWPAFAVSVTPGISTGVEYPGHILHGPGTATDILTHEVGHQWFYSLVGNNQARDPWLDEALTTWVEARYEGTVEDYRARPIPAGARGRTTAPMTFWDQRDDFYVGAYVQGAQALAALGEPDLVDCALRIFAAQNAYRIARAADFVTAASAVFPDAASVLAGYGIRP